MRLRDLCHVRTGPPSLNKTDRLLAIVLELHSHGLRRAEDLAVTFEVN